MELLLIYRDGAIRPIASKEDIARLFSSGEEEVFLVNGKDAEIYIVDDKRAVKQMEGIAASHTEDEARDIILKIINPEKYDT